VGMTGYPEVNFPIADYQSWAVSSVQGRP
jgi:hypothetical protein